MNGIRYMIDSAVGFFRPGHHRFTVDKRFAIAIDLFEIAFANPALPVPVTRFIRCLQISLSM